MSLYRAACNRINLPGQNISPYYFNIRKSDNTAILVFLPIKPVHKDSIWILSTSVFSLLHYQDISLVNPSALQSHYTESNSSPPFG